MYVNVFYFHKTPVTGTVKKLRESHYNFIDPYVLNICIR